MASRIEIMPTRFWPRVMAVFWLAEAVLGLGLGGFGLTMIGSEDGWLMAALIGGALVLVIAGVVMGAASWASATIRGPVIILDEAGFTDLRLSPQAVPWRALRWGVFATGRGATSLQFHAPPDYRVGWAFRLLGRLNSAMNYPPHVVMTLGTGKSVQELADMISGFRQPSF